MSEKGHADANMGTHPGTSGPTGRNLVEKLGFMSKPVERPKNPPKRLTKPKGLKRYKSYWQMRKIGHLWEQ